MKGILFILISVILFSGCKDEQSGSIREDFPKEDISKAEAVGLNSLEVSPTFRSGSLLPEAGIWRLDAYLNDKKFGSVTVEVEE